MPRVGRRVGAYFSDLAWCSRSVIRGGYGGERGAQYDDPSRRVAPAPVHAWTGYRGSGESHFLRGNVSTPGGLVGRGSKRCSHACRGLPDTVASGAVTG